MKGKMKKPSEHEQLVTMLGAYYKKDYVEPPVSMQRFLTDTDFLGASTFQGQAVYPIWTRTLTKLSNSPEKNLPIFTGAIGCLGPDVKVSLLDGRELSIPEIMEERKKGKQHWVYSYDIERKKIVPGKVTGALLSGKSVDNIVEVELDNKERILCTHDHPFLMSQGVYKKAEELEPGDSLMPLYREQGSGGYELIGAYKQQWRPTFRIVAEEIYGDIPKGSCVHHHPEGGKEDNSPENLEVMTVKEHIKLHSVKLNPFRNIPGLASECAKKVNDIRWNGPDNMQQRKEAGSRIKKRNKEEGQAKKASDRRWQGPGNKQQREAERGRLKKKNKETGQNIKASKIRWSKPGAGENQSKKMKEWWASRKLPIETRVCAAPGCDITFECEINSKRKYCCSGHSGKGRKKRNHKVISVKYYDKRIDVYDLSIEKYHNFALTSGVFVHNTGKTRAAIWGMMYVMHMVLCLKSPWKFFGKDAGGKMAIVFFNLTQTLGASKGFGLLQSYLLKSPWFTQRGRVVPSEVNPRIDFPIFEYVSGSPYAKGFGVQGHDIITALMDEVDSPAESDKQRLRVLKAFEAGYRRFENRFVGKSLLASDGRATIGKFFLVASKQEQLSFLNTFIAKMKNSPNVYIVDVPIWEAKPDAEYCGIKFPVMIGDLYTPSKVLGQEIGDEFESNSQAVDGAVRSGFQVINVPIEYLADFQRDIVGALRDFAGVSIAGMRKTKLFPSEKLLVDCYDPAKRDPISKLTIDVGLGDDVNFAEYIDFSAIRVPRHIPRYIHVDIAYSGEGDALGLGMSCISGWTEAAVENLEDGGEMKVEKLPVVETDFGMRIHARPGDKIPLSRVRKLIADLKIVYHFNIRLVTFDLDLLSEESKQILTRIGIDCDKLSLDRSPQIYRNFRDVVHSKRWCCHRDEYLHFELSNLEDDPDKNKVDHPDEVVDIEFLENGNTRDIVVKGSKDKSDGVVGSVENALRNSGSVVPEKFITTASRIMSKSTGAQTNPVHSLLGIDRRSSATTGGKKKDTSPKKTTDFKDIFNRSQKRI
jgi:intein/homing endonuclease